MRSAAVGSKPQGFTSTLGRVFVCCGICATSLTANARVDVKMITSPKALYELNRKNMYAIGATVDTEDFITVLNGSIHVSGNKDSSMKIRAAHLTYSNVISWSEAQLKGAAQSPTTIGALMNKMLKDLGYERAGMFPFLIKGTFSKLELISHKKQNSDGLSAAQSEKHITGLIVGFLTKTLPNANAPAFKLEMHFKNDGGTKIGFVRDFGLDADNNAALFMPR